MNKLTVSMTDENGREFDAYINPDDKGQYIRRYKDTGEEVYADNLIDVCSPVWLGDAEELHCDDRNTLPKGSIPRIDGNDRPFYIVKYSDGVEKIYLDSYEKEIFDDGEFLRDAKWLLEEDYDKYRVKLSNPVKLTTLPDKPRKLTVDTLFPKTLGYVEPKLDEYNLGEIVNGKPSLNYAEIVRLAQDMFIIHDRETWYMYNKQSQVYEEVSEETVLTTMIALLRRVPEAPYPLKVSMARDMMFGIRTRVTLTELAQMCKTENPSLYHKIANDYVGNLIPFQNCIYNINEDTMLPYTPYKFLKTKYDAIYDPSITEHPVEKIYRGIIPDEDTLSFFFEFVGYTMFHYELEPPIIFLLYGSTNTGKSALAETVQKALGYKNVSNLDLNQLSSQFEPSVLLDKVMNVSSETGSGQSQGRFGGRPDGELLKRLSGGEPITFSRKYKEPITQNNTAKMWFISNTMPDFGDFSSGMDRRLHIIPCRETQVYEHKIYDVMQERDAISWLVNQALDGYRRFLKRGGVFVQSDIMKAEHTRFKVQDSIYDFIAEYLGVYSKTDIRDALHEMEIKPMYEDYKLHTQEVGGRPFKRGNFRERICNEYSMIYKTSRIILPDGRPSNRQVFYKEGD